MVENLIRRLRKRGWEKEHIHRAVKIIHHHRQNKTKSQRAFDKVIYFVLLGLIVIANFVISIALIPFLLVLKGYFLYVVIITIGLAFGLLFELVIRSIEHLEAKHHIGIGLVIPAVAVANVFVITQLTNKISNVFSGGSHNPYTVSIIYAAIFLMPFAFFKLLLRRGYYAE